MTLRDCVRFNGVIERADRLLGSYNAAPLYYDLAFRMASSWGVSCFNYGYAPLSRSRAAWRWTRVSLSRVRDWRRCCDRPSDAGRVLKPDGRFVLIDSRDMDISAVQS
ncbi:MAG: hypothetical protein ABI442_21810 [Gemmatimonadaceae bacterium]